MLAFLRLVPEFPRIVYNLKTNKPLAIGFDVTNLCNLHCPYCYWQESKRDKQLDVDSIVEIAKKMRSRGVVHATWVGGEPTLRPDVLESVTPIFPINWIVTNGLPVNNPKLKDFDPFKLPNTRIILSLDGLGEAHDKSRNRPGLYDLVKERFWNKPILTTTTLHQGNKDQPRGLLEEWSNSDILGMTFEFATPIGRKANPEWDLVGEDRDEVIDELIELKKEYGRFMANSTYGLNMLRPKNLSKWVSPPRCPTTVYSRSFDEIGEIKSPCILGSSDNNPNGKKPSCSSCGCHVPAILNGLKRFDWQTIDSAFWFLRKKNPLK